MKMLLVITGPTAVGKTAVCLEWAEKLKTEIISCDSRQFYREMQIGTAAPQPDELQRIPHHFIGHLSVKDHYTVFTYEHDALERISERFRQHDILILTGGSGLYLNAVLTGMDDIPDPDPMIREALQKRLLEEGIESLRLELKHLDPDYYHEIDLKNPKRILRGLEVCLTTGKPFSHFRQGRNRQRSFQTRIIVLNRDREELYNRIDQRVDQMVQEGLEAEARELLPYRHLNALNTVGYKEFFSHFDGTISMGEAIRLIKRNTRHFSRRQLTWFRKYSNAHFVHPDQASDLLSG